MMDEPDLEVPGSGSAWREPRRMRRSARRRWAIGLVTGLTVGVGILVTGFIGGILGILALLLLAIEPGRDAPVGGLLVGAGLGWLAVFGTASARCGADCVSPDVTPWIATALGLLVAGLVLSIRAIQPTGGSPEPQGRIR